MSGLWFWNNQNRGLIYSNIEVALTYIILLLSVVLYCYYYINRIISFFLISFISFLDWFFFLKSCMFSVCTVARVAAMTFHCCCTIKHVNLSYLKYAEKFLKLNSWKGFCYGNTPERSEKHRTRTCSGTVDFNENTTELNTKTEKKSFRFGIPEKSSSLKKNPRFFKKVPMMETE